MESFIADFVLPMLLLAGKLEKVLRYAQASVLSLQFSLLLVCFFLFIYLFLQ